MKKALYILIALAALALWSCEPEIEEFEPSAGNADFSNYVALGNSLTAGFSNGSLYRSGQELSFPRLLAGQFDYVGGGNFEQPLMVDEAGLGDRLILGIDVNCLGEAGLGPVDYPGNTDPGNLNWIGGDGPYQNLGVPGAKIFHLLAPGYGLMNPYFGRFSSDPTSASVLGDAVAQQPTFFTLWIGSNDVLGYALSGGENPDSNSYDPITNVAEFEVYLNTLLDGLMAGGAKGAIANITDVTSIPFFNTIPYNALAIKSQADADALNQAYQQLGFQFNVGANPLVIQDLDAPGGMRQANPDDLVLLSLPQDSIRCAGWGSTVPVPHIYILDALEVANIRNAINAYNLKIQEAADARGLAYVDVNQALRNAESGIIFDGVEFSTAFVTGGAFSLDGVHLTGKGNAIVANFFIDAINQTFGAGIPKLLVNDYPGVQFP